MNFDFTPEQDAIRESILKVCAKYDDAYWLDRDRSGEFPEDFAAEFAAGGWLGIAMPTEYGGSGLGVTEAAIMMQAVSESGAGQSGASAIHMNIFGPNPIVVFGTDEQKRRFLPPLIAGRDRSCFGVTEPNSGLNTSALQTKAEWNGNQYIINGRKIWTSTAQSANKILLIVRTSEPKPGQKAADGLSLFYADLDRDYVDVTEIEKMGRKCVDSNSVFIDNLPVPAENLLGEEGKGFKYLLHGLNPERVLIAAEAIGLGRVALKRAVQYAKERIVFDRPIGMNQAIQHPLAKCWMDLEAANLMMLKAAALYDAGLPCGAEANTAKYLASEAGYRACEQAVLTLGGMGYAKEFQVERYFREIMISRIAPVSREMILNFVSEQVLELPKSY